jgi:putative superfamily III holin-X
MTETPEQAQAGVADALHDLSDNSRALVRHEIGAAQREMLGKAKQALPALGLLGAAAFLGTLSAAASFRLSVRLLEKTLPPATAAFVAAAGYSVAAGAAAALGIQRLRAVQPLFPAETARDTARTVADATGQAAAG